MATPNERRALYFLAGMALLGGGVRVARSAGTEPPPAAARAALAHQIGRADSARRAGIKERSAARRTASAARRPGTRAASRASAQSPLMELAAPTPAPDAMALRQGPPSAGLVDLDRADAASMERLPRIGPALARRILEDRQRNGAFGGLDGLQRVRGIGPALARTLAPHVTFSGASRLSDASARSARSTNPRSRSSTRRARSSSSAPSTPVRSPVTRARPP